MSEHLELLELVESHALGALDALDRERLEAHLLECEECSEALVRAYEVTDVLAASLPPIDPPTALRARLLAEVQGDAAATPLRRRGGWVEHLALAASLAGLLWLGSQRGALLDALEVEREARRDAEAATSDSQRELASLQVLVDGLGTPAARVVALRGQAPMEAASARAWLDPATRSVVLFVSDLPRLPPGQTYQLWVITGDGPISAGVFAIGEDERIRYDARETPPLEGEVTIAVTIEPDGGVAKPTGPIVLVGT